MSGLKDDVPDGGVLGGVLGSLSTADFLREYWQQRALLVHGALSRTQELLDGDDLAGLACEEGIASRLVIHDPRSRRWHCEHGPFDEGRFADLPEHDWTLLVQGVEQWFPAVAALLARFDFLPRWRVDDIMASYATPGGGVGPHFDYYDVFLIQARGRRRWRLGQHCDDTTPLENHPELKLLAAFHEQSSHDLEPGDMLYVPPGQSHLGTALGEDCITLSVGFRAPSHAEILQGMAASLAQSLGGQHRYTDPAGVSGGDPHRIDAAALTQLDSVLGARDPAAVRGALADAFGRLVTEPRQPDLVDAPDAASLARIEARLSAGGSLRLRHHPASRFAYAITADGALLFVDGESHLTTAAVARDICGAQVQASVLDEPLARSLLLHLVQQGSLELR